MCLVICSDLLYFFFKQPYFKKITSGSTNVFKTFPLFSAVVTIDSGKITGIVWDNGCWDGSGTVRIIV